MEVSLHDAKAHLSQLVEKALLGEEIIIAKAGKPAVKLVRVQEPPHRRILGSAEGQIWFSEGWDAPMTDAELQELLGG
jgi:prevent-host-death family protein